MCGTPWHFKSVPGYPFPLLWTFSGHPATFPTQFGPQGVALSDSSFPPVNPSKGLGTVLTRKSFQRSRNKTLGSLNVFLSIEKGRKINYKEPLACSLAAAGGGSGRELGLFWGPRGYPGWWGLIPNFCKRSQVRLRFFGASAHSSALASLPWPKRLCELMGLGEELGMCRCSVAFTCERELFSNESHFVGQ